MSFAHVVLTCGPVARSPPLTVIDRRYRSVRARGGHGVTRRLPVVAPFDHVKESFWGSGIYGLQPPLTDEMVRQAEGVLGVTLPSSLLDLLRVQNGGRVAPEWNAFPTTRAPAWSADHVPFDTVLGIGSKDSLLDTPYLVEEWGLPSPIVLLAGDGHCWIGLDYRECGCDGEPSVTWFDTELETEVALAADFRSFVEDLSSVGSYGGDYMLP